MPKASRDCEPGPWLASGRPHRTATTLTRASPRQCRRRAESATGRPGRQSAEAMRSAPTPSRALRGNTEGEPRLRAGPLAGERASAPNRDDADASLFEAMPQASRVSGWSASLATDPGDAIGDHAVASPSRRCRRRAESPAGRPRWQPTRAKRSATTPSRSLQGDAAGEPSRQLVDLASVRPGRGDRRPAPLRALRGNAAGEPSQQLVGLACVRPRRFDRRPRRRKPFEAMPQASRVSSRSTWPAFDPGDSIGVHAVASPSRQCSRRTEMPAGRLGRQSAQAMRSAPLPTQAFRGNAAGEPEGHWPRWRRLLASLRPGLRGAGGEKGRREKPPPWPYRISGSWP